MRFDIITIFPQIFNSYFNESILKRAQQKKLVKINIHNLRDYAVDKHKTVDDRPYGGGAGMIMKVEPIYKAVKILKGKRKTSQQKIILLSAKGKEFNQVLAKKYAQLDRLILICGRYEGVDERVAKKIADEEISVGKYVLTGGELPAMIIVDAVTRLLSGVIKKESLLEESFTKKGFIEYPQYTRPENFQPLGWRVRGWPVPKILLSGDHKKIEEWKKKKSLKIK